MFLIEHVLINNHKKDIINQQTSFHEENPLEGVFEIILESKVISSGLLLMTTAKVTQTSLPTLARESQAHFLQKRTFIAANNPLLLPPPQTRGPSPSLSLPGFSLPGRLSSAPKARSFPLTSKRQEVRMGIHTEAGQLHELPQQTSRSMCCLRLSSSRRLSDKEGCLRPEI